MDSQNAGDADTPGAPPSAASPPAAPSPPAVQPPDDPRSPAPPNVPPLPVAAFEPLAISATRLLWGTAIILIDLEFETVDVVNDLIGMLLVVVGLTRLADWASTHAPHHLREIAIARWFGWAALLLTLAQQAVALGAGTTDPTFVAGSLDPLDIGLGLVQLAGTLLVVAVLGTVTQRAGWERSARSWRATRTWFLAGGAVVVVAGGIGLLAEAPVFAVPVVAAILGAALHLCVSLYRTERDATAAALPNREHD